jgi:DNA-binding response OmpR family regulator
LPSETTRAEVNERLAETSNKGKQVLVVEDDSDAAELLQLFISHLGHTVTVETSGSDALQSASDKRFDHVLMDLTLPDYNGYDLAKELKAAQPSARITIVSGHEADSQMMSEIGIDNALLKPVTKDDLESVID